MKAVPLILIHHLVTLSPANEQNVELLIRWTLDPVAQGPYKQLPTMTVEALWALFLHSSDRQYFLLTRTADGQALGRFYYRAWHLDEEADCIDWELNIFIADPDQRGKGYGTATQHLASDYLLTRPETRSVFAYTEVPNTAERRALQKAGFTEIGLLPQAYYRIELPQHPSVLYGKQKRPPSP